MNCLEIKNLSKNFGGINAVKNMTFNVESNNITSLIGPNGAGKTTMFNLISRVIETDSGIIKFNDENLLKYKPHQISKLGISRTFQNVALFDNMSLLENVMLGAHTKCDSSILKYLFSFSLSAKEDKELKEKSAYYLEFVGLQNKINSEVAELGFGQQRLIEIARALMSECALLLLDEPAAGLNPKETDDLSNLLIKIKETMNKTIFIVEHDMNLVMKISDHIIVMNFGEYLAEGNPRQISNNKDVIKAYLGE